MKMQHGLPFLAAALLLPAVSVLAQETGTSHPEQLNDTVDATVQAAPQHYQKPSPAVPATAPTGNYGAGNYGTFTVVGPAVATDGQQDHYAPRRSEPGFSPSSPAFNPNDVNSGVVTSVYVGPNDLPIGTRIAGHLNNTISTRVTPAGTRFAAEVPQAIVREGRVLVPAGSVINGRITQIHGGRRISGASAIRLQADQIVLPNGVSYRINAEVVDIDHYNASHVNHEGVITSSTSAAVPLGAAGLTTATGAVAGAMIGGGVGAVVGAGVGAGLGAYWWLRTDHQQTLPTGTEIVFSLNDVLTVAPTQATAAY